MTTKCTVLVTHTDTAPPSASCLQNKHLNPEEEAKPPCVKFQSTLLLETESNPPRSRPTILPNLMMYTNHLLMLSIYHFLCCLPHQEYNYNVHSKIVMEIQWM